MLHKDTYDIDERTERKRRRMARNAAWALGLGVGLLVARVIAPLIMGEGADQANRAFMSFGLTLIVYGAVQIFCLVFLKKKALLAGGVLTYLVMPAVLIKLVMDLSG